MSALRGPFVAQHVFVLIALVSLMNAIAQTKDEPSVTVQVQPDRIAPGGAVTISGLGYVQSGGSIAITVTTPTGTSAKLMAIPDNQTRYSTQYIGAAAPGTYSVSAQAGAKSTPAKTQFTVQSTTIDIDEDVADNKKFLEAAQDLVTTLKKQVDTVPDSPAKTEMSAKLDKLMPALNTVTQQSTHLASMVQPFKSLLAQHPQTQPALQPFLDHMAELDEKTREDSQALVKLSAQSQRTLKGCDTIDQSTQALKGLSEVLDAAHDPFEFVTAYASGLAGSAIPGAGPAAEQAARAASLAEGISEAGESEEGLNKATHAAAGSAIEGEIELGGETAIANKLLAALPESLRSSNGYALAVTEVKKFAPRVVKDGGDVIKQFVNAAALATDVATYANEGFLRPLLPEISGLVHGYHEGVFLCTGV